MALEHDVLCDGEDYYTAKIRCGNWYDTPQVGVTWYRIEVYRGDRERAVAEHRARQAWERIAGAGKKGGA